MTQGYSWAGRLAKPMTIVLLGGALAASAGVHAQEPVGASAASQMPASGAIIMAASSSTPEAVAKKAGVKVTKVGDTRAKPVATMDVITTQLVPVEAARAKVEGYFNTLSTLQADFSQSVTGQDMASEGMFSYKRPRQFLFQYDTPTKQKIVSTGTAVYYVDQSSGHDSQVTQLPMSAGLGRIFGAKHLDLKDAGLRVSQAAQTASVLRVLVMAEKVVKMDDQAGLKQAWLVFDRLDGDKLQLARIEALDTLGVTTTVTFSHIKTGIPLSGSLFEYTPGVYKNSN